LPGPVDAFAKDPSRRLASAAYREAIEAYVAAEVTPHVADAWVDHSRTKIGYEVPVTRHFYRYVPPRPLAQIDADLRRLEEDIQRLLREVTA
jgi:type I restriction enzyme M protein